MSLVTINTEFVTWTTVDYHMSFAYQFVPTPVECVLFISIENDIDFSTITKHTPATVCLCLQASIGIIAIRSNAFFHGFDVVFRCQWNVLILIRLFNAMERFISFVYQYWILHAEFMSEFSSYRAFELSQWIMNIEHYDCGQFNMCALSGAHYTLLMYRRKRIWIPYIYSLRGRPCSKLIQNQPQSSIVDINVTPT